MYPASQPAKKYVWGYANENDLRIHCVAYTQRLVIHSWLFGYSRQNNVHTRKHNDDGVVVVASADGKKWSKKHKDNKRW